MKKKKSKMPIYIPNQPQTGFMGFDTPDKTAEELRRQRQNQKLLALKSKNKTMKIPECDDSKEFMLTKITNVIIVVVVGAMLVIGLKI